VAAEPRSLTRLGETKELSEMLPTTSSAWVKGIIESLDRAGLDARLLLMEAGRPMRVLQRNAPLLGPPCPAQGGSTSISIDDNIMDDPSKLP
jgi:hypothetical protein